MSYTMQYVTLWRDYFHNFINKSHKSLYMWTYSKSVAKLRDKAENKW